MTAAVTFTAEIAGANLTPASMATALESLSRLTVPGDARLKINQYTNGNRWEIRATWSAKPQEDDAAPITASANLDLAVDAAGATQRVRAIQRRIQDNPQA